LPEIINVAVTQIIIEEDMLTFKHRLQMSKVMTERC